jgi:hypothetical protein
VFLYVSAAEALPSPSPPPPTQAFSPTPTYTPTPYGGYGYATARLGTVAHSLIMPSQEGAPGRVVAHAHIKPCSVDKGGAHWMYDVSKSVTDTSNQLHLLGPAEQWYQSEVPWKVSAGGTSADQESRPRSVVVHDPDTMAKALCCDLVWD